MRAAKLTTTSGRRWGRGPHGFSSRQESIYQHSVALLGANLEAPKSPLRRVQRLVEPSDRSESRMSRFSLQAADSKSAVPRPTFRSPELHALDRTSGEGSGGVRGRAGGATGRAVRTSEYLYTKPALETLPTG